MEAILPFKIKNEQKFYESALKVGYNEMEIYKFVYVMQQSDLDIFPKMHDERINVLLYGWELCEDYKQKLNPDEWELPEEMEVMLKLLVPWSMDIWFSKEWDKCKYYLKIGLIHCLNRARDLLMRMPDMMQINWDFLLLYNLKPWNVLYLKNLTVTKDKTLETGAQSIETEELPATREDIAYVNLEQLPLMVLRLVKLFDQTSIDMVKTLCMRVIAAWNKIHQTELETSGSRRPYIPPEDKRCLLLICHIYLMAVYESDDVKGYIIDNMINNIRFYYQGFQNSASLYAMDNLEYTPARFIALTNIHLRVQKRDFFDFFIWNKYDTSLVNLFGVVSQAYKSYLLGNLLMELNNMNEDDFASNIPLYKRLMNSYVNEREKSESYLLNELQKLEAQRYAHNIIQTVKNVTDFKSKICKGNRMSNIGNYENSDDTVTPLAEDKCENKVEDEIKLKVDEVRDEVVDEVEDEQEQIRVKENELRLDPIFQNLPNNESILYYVYEVLAKKDYKGWHFAKIVLLVKIIDHELNMIETWRYHPGLTTDFMLNLEVNLSQHYVDLAKIFKDHAFLEQEFWLTAFYLNPTPDVYETIKRLGMRNNRKRTDEQTKLVMSKDNIEAKYGLLSSTIDVKEIAILANTDDPDTDYDPLFSALHSLRVPDSLVKDMITAIFLPRNKSFAWVVDWNALRTRCKMILTSSKEKKRFVELNMAEANERLKYLIIDYEKYKNRPQLDYGTIEEGYENLMASGDFDKETDDEEEEEDEEEDFEDDEDVYESKRRGRGCLSAAARKKEEEKIEDDNSQEDDPFLMGKRRTRARTAATLASYLFQTLPRSSRRKRNQKPEDETKAEEDKTDNDDKSSDSKSPITSESPMPPSSPVSDSCEQKNSSQSPNVPSKNIKECLKERPKLLNSTQGFQNLVDIWNIEKSDLLTIDENCVTMMESTNVLQRAVKWKLLNKEINPLGCDEQEIIDETEMVIHNAEYAINMEYNLKSVKQEQKPDVAEEVMNVESVAAMEIDEDHGESVVDKVDKVSKDTVTVQEAKESTPNVVEEALVEKVIEQESPEIEQNEKSTPAEENSSESINSDMSTAAFKDSGEVIESNTENNSKRNSVNDDPGMEINKVVQSEDSNEQSETAAKQKENAETEKVKTKEQQMETSNKHKESVEMEKEKKDDELEKEEINQEEETDEEEGEKVKEEDNKIERFTDENETSEKSANDVQIIIKEEHEDTDSKDKNKTIEAQQLKDIGAKEKSDLRANPLFENDSDKLTAIDNESNNAEAKSTLSTENASSQLKEISEKGSKEQEIVTETISQEDEREPLEETNVSKEISLNDQEKVDDKAQHKETKTDDKRNGKLQTIKDSLEDKQNEESHIPEKTSEKDTESKIVTENSVKTNDTNEELDSSKLQHQEDENERLTVKELDEKDAQSQTLEHESNLVLHYSSSEEVDALVGKTESEKIDSKKYTHSPITAADNNTLDSLKSEDGQESTDSETRTLKKICLTKSVKVLVRKLRSSDLTTLRQPKVKIKRMSYDKYVEEFKAKRRRVIGRVYLDLDDSSVNSYDNNSSSSDTYHPPYMKKKIPARRHSMRQLRTSDSDNDSKNSDDLKLSSMVAKSKVRKRRLSTPSSSQSSTFGPAPKLARHVTGPKSVRHITGPKSSKQNLVVTPRSASGLKLRISNAEQGTNRTSKKSSSIAFDDVIQLSSSSSDTCIVNELPSIEEEVIEVEDHPLFEEEIII